MKINLAKGHQVEIDDQDAELVAGFHWYAIRRPRTNYAAAHIKKADGQDSLILMHRLLLRAIPDGLEVDHIDGNGLNNCRANLRICSHAQNRKNTKRPRSNTSGFKGVHKHTQTGRWIAQIVIDGKGKGLGSFDTPQAAHAAYCAAAREHYGEYARMD